MIRKRNKRKEPAEAGAIGQALPEKQEGEEKKSGSGKRAATSMSSNGYKRKNRGFPLLLYSKNSLTQGSSQNSLDWPCILHPTFSMQDLIEVSSVDSL